MFAVKHRNLVSAWKLNRFYNGPNLSSSRLIRKASTNSNKSEENDRPVKYSTSAANLWQAQYSRIGTDSKDRLWYEPPVVLISLGIFMIYFCILREESDIDLELSKSLYDRIEGLEKQQVEIALNYNKEHGLPIGELQKRLKELEEIEQQTNERKT